MLFQKTITALPTAAMQCEFTAHRRVTGAQIEKFFGVDGYDVYNPSVPFVWEGKEYIAGRVEKRDSEHAEVRFFERTEGGWTPAEGTQRLALQDPFVTFVDGKLVLGGVRVTFPEKAGDPTLWCTDFYIGSPFRLERFATGPAQMKDVRLVQLKNGKIALVSRPQGASMEKYGCISKVGFAVIDSLDEFNAEVIENAPYLEKMFCDDEWGGCNQLIELKNGKVGVIGHKAYRTYAEDGSQQLHYYGIAFAVDPETREFTQNKIIISSDCFPSAASKRPDLADVTFTSGIVRRKDGTAHVYTGLKDANVASAIIPDPFTEYEN